MKKQRSTEKKDVRVVEVEGKHPNVKIAFAGGNGIQSGYEYLAQLFIDKYFIDGQWRFDGENQIRKELDSF